MELITQLKDHKNTNMKLLSTITAMCLSIAFATAAEVGEPIQARQGCSITMFTGRGFTGTSSTLSGNQCVSTYHLSTASSTDLIGLVHVVRRVRAVRLEPPLRESLAWLRLLPLHWQLVQQLR